MVCAVMRKLVVAMLVLAGCGPGEPHVGGAYLIDAADTIKAPEGPTIVVGKDKLPSKLSGPVRLAADRNLPYADVIAAAKAVKAAGGQPVLLVARREFVEALPEAAQPSGAPAIRIAAREGGKACVSPPDNDEATCVSRKDAPRIDRAFVRQLTNRAVSEYGLKDVHVKIDPGLTWGDGVRAIDGARTCCETTPGLVVSVEPTY
jgi:hypothetical protein